MACPAGLNALGRVTIVFPGGGGGVEGSPYDFNQAASEITLLFARNKRREIRAIDTPFVR
jgi:hypothetical protein